MVDVSWFGWIAGSKQKRGIHRRRCFSRLGLPPIHPVKHQQRGKNNPAAGEVKGENFKRSESGKDAGGKYGA